MRQQVWNDAIVELKIACKMRAMCAVFSLINRKTMRNSVGAGVVKGWVGTLASPRAGAVKGYVGTLASPRADL